jgi:hypothetical protein
VLVAGCERQHEHALAVPGDLVDVHCLRTTVQEVNEGRECNSQFAERLLIAAGLARHELLGGAVDPA